MVAPAWITAAVTTLLLKRAPASRPSGEWNEDDFDVLADGGVVGRIFKANAAPVGYGNDEKRCTFSPPLPLRRPALPEAV
jgi:hypothetical protein